MPAARLKANDARIAAAQVSRVNFSFTLGHLDRFRRTGTGNRAASPLSTSPEVPGFASPSRDGFALDGRSTEGVSRPRAHATGGGPEGLGLRGSRAGVLWREVPARTTPHGAG